MSTSFVVSRDGTELVGESWPNNGPVITLLHAGVADRRSWIFLVPDFEKFASVHAYDRRGFGESLTTNEPFTHLEDLLAVLDHLHIASTWLVGSSAGGKLALEAALEAPHRKDGVVLISPAVGGAPQTRDEDVDPETEEIDGLITRADELGDNDEVNRLEVRLWLDGPREPEGRVSGAVRELVIDMNATALANFVAENADNPVDAWSRLGELLIPTTVACGNLDATHIIRRSEVVGARIRGANCVFLEGVAHLPYLENPSPIGALIRDSILRARPTRKIPD
ncbi:MAG TPA: alpha/beta hydrolase [Acidimicrobiales bacterium]|nr:alpha/beta hydrolase [Acidimicrobiales bacterium]